MLGSGTPASFGTIRVMTRLDVTSRDLSRPLPGQRRQPLPETTQDAFDTLMFSAEKLVYHAMGKICRERYTINC